MIGAAVNTADYANTRRSLLGQFTFEGNTVYALANHLPSKGGSGDFWQFNQTQEAGEPANGAWAARNAIADDIYTLLNYIQNNSAGGTAKIISGGDYNDFYFYRPLEAATGYVYADGTARADGAKLANLALALPEAERYSYTFDGRSQEIDHVIANQALSDVASIDIVHINSGFTAATRISDHDPVLTQFDFRNFAETLNGTAAAETIMGFGGNDIIDGKGGADTLVGGTGDDTYYVDSLDDVVTELSNEGNDTVYSSVANYVLPANVETLVYTGTTSETLSGNSGDNNFTGGSGDDRFDFSQGGIDRGVGGAGNDGFVFGATFGTGDSVDGGVGTNDQLILQGAYGSVGTPFVLRGAQIVNTEVIALLGGFNYVLSGDGGLYAAGVRTIYASNTLAGDSFTVNLSNETSPIIVYGGRATDSITTGSGDDGVYFGPGRFDPTLDRVDAGAGTNDQLALDGDYGTVGSPLVLTGTAIQGVEGIVLIAGPTSAPSHFNIAFANDFANAGETKYIQGITVTTAMTITAVAETDATSSYQFNAGLGDDTLVGGAGNDRLFGNLGRDTLTGGGGADTFFYDAAVQSSSTHYDTITDFQVGSDTIDLPATYTAPATVNGGQLNDATFDADLATALNATLTVGRAVIFTPSTGDHAGQTFLVADANATAGYQADGDYVIQIVTAPANTPLVGILS